MKALHRIRRSLSILLLLMLHCATAADFSKCGYDEKIVCFAHGSCQGITTMDKYISVVKEQIRDEAACKRYFIIQAKSLEKVDIDFHDNSFVKATGAGFFKGHTKLFSCQNNVATAPTSIGDVEDNSDTSEAELHCKFTLTATNNPKNIQKVLQSNRPDYIKALPLAPSGLSIQIQGYSTPTFSFCDWDRMKLFTANTVADEDEDSAILEPAADNTQRTCRTDYFNWYKAPGTSEWVKISDYTCKEGTVNAAKKKDSSELVLDTEAGSAKCTRKKCAQCTCDFCEDNNPERPKFTGTDGTTCATITCAKKMLVDTASSSVVHPSTTLTCTVDGKWESFNDIRNVTCIDKADCTKMNPITSKCEGVDVAEEKNCTKARPVDTGEEVCDGKETHYKTNGGIEHHATSFKCNPETGTWKVIDADTKSDEVISKGTNVYCLEDKKEEATAAPKTGSMSGGTLIGIIVGVAFVVVIIVIVLVLCLRRYFKKKGNRDEMKSVSVTGKNKKSKRGKKGKSSSSKTSEQISAPPPPPCPDSLNFRVEPDPVKQQSSQQPSSGGAAAPAAVGPDTGKPDKPAELIDIKLESEKKDTEKESKKEGKDEATVVNTVTGTAFDKSNVGAPPKDGTTVSTKKTDKNGESARSDTGRNSNVGDRKKKVKVNKDGKVELDKHGRGMTDDDDYNIDEGAKPVNTVEKNKKPYLPADDPRKKMINVTVTEDEEGKIQPKNKPPLF